MNDVLACIVVDGGGIVAVGSTKGTCVECGTAVWIAPSGRTIMREKRAKPTCMRCVVKQLAEAADDPLDVEPLTQEQLAEIVTTLLLQARRN